MSLERMPGIYSDLDIDIYHSEDGISSTGVSLILDCPKRYWHEYINKQQLTEQESTKLRDSFSLGRAAHVGVLEPHKLHDIFYIMKTDVNLTTKVGKEEYEKARIEANGRQIIRAKDWIDIEGIMTSASRHSLWLKMHNPLCEQSIFWNGGLYNTRLRARPDCFNDDFIIDLKTTRSIKGFCNSIYNYGYHRQAAMQIDGLKQLDGKDRKFGFLVVENSAPYLTKLFFLNDDYIEKGRQEYLEAAATYSECLVSGDWPSYEDDEVSLPKWATMNEEDFIYE